MVFRLEVTDIRKFLLQYQRGVQIIMLCKGKTFFYDPGTVNGTEVKTLFEVEAMAESLTSELSSSESSESSMEASHRTTSALTLVFTLS